MRGRRRLLAVTGVALLPLTACEPTDPAVERISETEGDGVPNGRSYAPSISDDGRWVAYVSEASNLDFADSDDGVADVFAYDRVDDRNREVSGFGGRNGPSGWAPFCSGFEGGVGCSDSPFSPEAPAISDDGGTVAFTSFATDIVFPAPPVVPQVYAARPTGPTALVSQSSAEVPANAASLSPAVSGNGRFVTFWSYADNLVPGDTNESPDLFVRDLEAGTTRRVNTTASGGQSGRSDENFETDIGGGLLSVYHRAPLSDDGRYVAFLSVRGDLGPSGLAFGSVYRKDLLTGGVALVSDPSLGNRAEAPWISANGNFVSFSTAFWFNVNRDAPCVSCFHFTPTAPPLRVVRNVSEIRTTELIPGNPFPGAPDVSGDGSLRAFELGGENSHVYVRHLPSTVLGARHRINAGGPGFSGLLLKTWDADRGFIAGSTHTVTNAIGFTADDPLYRSERWGMSGYELAVPNGRYRVRLLVAEISPTTPRRVFDVRAEGQLVVDDFDIRATFHAFEATTLEFVVPVTDGRLDLDFSASSNAPTVAALEVLDARLPDERITP
jgi:hypothetical protein